MKEISCLIIEDNSSTIDMICGMLADNFAHIKVLDTAGSIEKGYEIITTLGPDFIFLDINLEDGKTGFELLQRIRPAIDFKIIFITSYSKYAIEAFKFSALDFILKPFSKDDLVQAVFKVTNELEKATYTQKLETFFHNYSFENKKIVLSNLDSINIVAVEDIVYAKSDNTYTTFYCSNGKSILVSKPLKHFQEKLSRFRFFRSHQSYLVNLNHLLTYDKKKDSLLLTGNISIPVSHSNKKTLLQYINQLGKF